MSALSGLGIPPGLDMELDMEATTAPRTTMHWKDSLPLPVSPLQPHKPGRQLIPVPGCSGQALGVVPALRGGQGWLCSLWLVSEETTILVVAATCGPGVTFLFLPVSVA